MSSYIDWEYIKNCANSCDKLSIPDITPTSPSSSMSLMTTNYKYSIIDLKKPEIKQIIFNGPATIVYWKDGSKTVVKCSEGDTFDPEVGIMMTTLKKIFGDDYPKYKNSVKKAYDNAIWQKKKENT